MHQYRRMYPSLPQVNERSRQPREYSNYYNPSRLRTGCVDVEFSTRNIASTCLQQRGRINARYWGHVLPSHSLLPCSSQCRHRSLFDWHPFIEQKDEQRDEQRDRDTLLSHHRHKSRTYLAIPNDSNLHTNELSRKKTKTAQIQNNILRQYSQFVIITRLFIN